MAETATAKKLTPEMVIDAYRKYKLEQGGGSGGSIASSNWPTALNHECKAYAYWNRTVPGEERTPFSPELKMIFSEGNDQERIVKRDLEDAGFTITGQQQQMADPKHQIYGRQDFQISTGYHGESVHVDVKSCSRYTFDYLDGPEDLLNPGKDWLLKWYKQVCLYMYLLKVDRYWIILKSKEKGAIKILEFLINDDIQKTAETMIAKADWVNKLIKIGKVPKPEDKISDADYCSECQFFAACLPDMNFGPPALILDAETIGELEIQLDRREELLPAHKEYEDLDAELKQVVKSMTSEGQTKMVIGKWVSSIKEINRKAYAVAATTYKQIKFLRV